METSPVRVRGMRDSLVPLLSFAALGVERQVTRRSPERHVILPDVVWSGEVIDDPARVRDAHVACDGIRQRGIGDHQEHNTDTEALRSGVSGLPHSQGAPS